MDNARLQDEILAKLIGILDKPVMQMVEAAVSVVLRNYDVTRKETSLSTTVVEFPELDMFLSRCGSHSRPFRRSPGRWRELAVFEHLDSFVQD